MQNLVTILFIIASVVLFVWILVDAHRQVNLFGPDEDQPEEEDAVNSDEKVY